MCLSTGGRLTSPEERIKTDEKEKRERRDYLRDWVDVPYGAFGVWHILQVIVLHPRVGGAECQESDGEPEGEPDHHTGDEPHKEDPKEGNCEA